MRFPVDCSPLQLLAAWPVSRGGTTPNLWPMSAATEAAGNHVSYRALRASCPREEGERLGRAQSRERAEDRQRQGSSGGQRGARAVKLKKVKEIERLRKWELKSGGDSGGVKKAGEVGEKEILRKYWNVERVI